MQHPHTSGFAAQEEGGADDGAPQCPAAYRKVSVLCRVGDRDGHCKQLRSWFSLFVCLFQSRRGERLRRSSDRVPALPSGRESWGSGQLGRYGVIPPLGEEWSDGGAGRKNITVAGRSELEGHTRGQPNDPLSHCHQHHSVLTYPPPTLLPNPLPFHGGTILPGYPQVYPMIPHPPVPLMASPLQYIPSPPLQYHLPTHPPPTHFVQPPEITELHRRVCVCVRVRACM